MDWLATRNARGTRYCGYWIYHYIDNCKKDGGINLVSLCWTREAIVISWIFTETLYNLGCKFQHFINSINIGYSWWSHLILADAMGGYYDEKNYKFAEFLIWRLRPITLHSTNSPFNSKETVLYEIRKSWEALFTSKTHHYFHISTRWMWQRMKRSAPESDVLANLKKMKKGYRVPNHTTSSVAS